MFLYFDIKSLFVVPVILNIEPFFPDRKRLTNLT
uniref:Uncharacterized protein n=1 Tax=Anguilla anguilla TaxID=7936 RepID=A0A0E9UAF6_ANGAN